MRALVAALLFGWSSMALAAQVRLDLANTSLREGQTVEMELLISGGRLDREPTIRVPSGLEISFLSQRRSTSLINGRISRELVLIYNLTAVEVGRYRIPPATIRVDSQQLSTQPLLIEVLPRSTGARAPGVTAQLDAGERLWLGQTVVYHAELEIPGQVMDVSWVPPAFEGFVAEQYSTDLQQDGYYKEDEVLWTVYSLDYVRVATGAGSRTIGPGRLVAQYRMPGNRRRSQREQFFSEAIPVEVHPLPEEGREDFSGLVGEFTLESTLSEPQVNLGDSVTLTLRITGNGTLAAMTLPPAPGDARYRAYDDTPEIVSTLVEGRFQAVGTWKRAIVPEEEGALEIAPLRLRVFDPVAGRYRVLSSAPLTLLVNPGQSRAEVENFQLGEGSNRVADLAEDILPIHPRARLRSQVVRLTDPALVGVAALPLTAWGGLVIWGLFSSRRPRENPNRDLRRKLRRVSSDVVSLEALFREVLGLALGRSAAGIDRAAIVEGLHGELQAEVLTWYKALEAVRYGGQDLSRGQVAQIRACIARVLEQA